MMIWLQRTQKIPAWLIETATVVLIALTAVLGLMLVTAASAVRQGIDPTAAITAVLPMAGMIAIPLAGFYIFSRWRGLHSEKIIWPVVSLILVIGVTMIFRLRGEDGFSQQIWRGLIPGLIIAGWLVAKPHWIEKVRGWAPIIGLLGLLLPVATALLGVVDETGARLALKLGPLPAVQTSELIKLSMIIFLAWYVEDQGMAAESRGIPILGFLRLPALPYFIPGVLFVAVASLALVSMSDYGAVLILASIFVAMLYAGFETRIFAAVAAIALGLASLAGWIIALTWKVPAVIQYRFLAFVDPWSTAMITIDGQPAGITIAEGPGYQIQQAIYAVLAGGVTGRGLGFGTPQFVPLAHSDFIFAAITEELGAVTAFALLFLFAVLILRIFRIVFMIPVEQVFERLLLVGIGTHLFIQVFVMAGGTLNLLPVTGVTIPFLSLGGMALLVNLVEIGMALALVRRMEGAQA
jgi:cell division protein FtsW (lipid II flippase)